MRLSEPFAAVPHGAINTLPGAPLLVLVHLLCNRAWRATRLGPVELAEGEVAYHRADYLARTGFSEKVLRTGLIHLRSTGYIELLRRVGNLSVWACLPRATRSQVKIAAMTGTSEVAAVAQGNRAGVIEFPRATSRALPRATGSQGRIAAMTGTSEVATFAQGNREGPAQGKRSVPSSFRSLEDQDQNPPYPPKGEERAMEVPDDRETPGALPPDPLPDQGEQGEQPATAPGGRGRANSAPAKPASPRPRRTHIPEDWTPSQQAQDFVIALGADPDVTSAAFRRESDADGRRKADWDLAFQAWVEARPRLYRRADAHSGSHKDTIRRLQGQALELVRRGPPAGDVPPEIARAIDRVAGKSGLPALSAIFADPESSEARLAEISLTSAVAEEVRRCSC